VETSEMLEEAFGEQTLGRTQVLSSFPIAEEQSSRFYLQHTAQRNAFHENYN
jgi:hypothetical protein